MQCEATLSLWLSLFSPGGYRVDGASLAMRNFLHWLDKKSQRAREHFVLPESLRAAISTTTCPRPKNLEYGLELPPVPLEREEG